MKDSAPAGTGRAPRARITAPHVIEMKRRASRARRGAVLHDVDPRSIGA